jgi:hypothetical protein
MPNVLDSVKLEIPSYRNRRINFDDVNFYIPKK